MPERGLGSLIWTRLARFLSTRVRIDAGSALFWWSLVVSIPGGSQLLGGLFG